MRSDAGADLGSAAVAAAVDRRRDFFVAGAVTSSSCTRGRARPGGRSRRAGSQRHEAGRSARAARGSSWTTVRAARSRGMTGSSAVSPGQRRSQRICPTRLPHRAHTPQANSASCAQLGVPTPDRSDSLVTEVGTGLSATAGSERSRRATPSRVLGAGALVAVSPGHLQPRSSASSNPTATASAASLMADGSAIPRPRAAPLSTQNGRAGPRVLRVRIGRRSCPRWQPSRLHGHAVRAESEGDRGGRALGQGRPAGGLVGSSDKLLDVVTVDGPTTVVADSLLGEVDGAT